MRIEWQVSAPKDWRADAVLFFLFENAPGHLPGLKRFLEEVAPWLKDSAAPGDFQAKANEVAVFYAPPGEGPIPRVVFVGLGPEDRFEAEKLKNAAAFGMRKCRELNVRRPAIALLALEGLPVDAAAGLREVLVGAATGLHRFDELKTRNLDQPAGPEAIAVLSESAPGPALSDIPALVEAESSGILLARDLTVSPANRATPGFLAETARGLAERFGFKIEVIDQQSARSLGMGAFAAVAQGSSEPACIVVLRHEPPGTENDAPLVFVGKGITFDTGGISLKPSDRMHGMKQDMAGAGAVLGAFHLIGSVGLARRVVGILPLAENMPGGRAYKPGDVIGSYSGQTIEVISTDAEGRMVLCDALAYAVREFKPAGIVDIATLTGACLIALGNRVAAVLGNREGLVRSIREIGREVGELFWPLPLWDFYFEALKSDVADMKNVGDRTAGTIIGGIFLKQFVPNEIPWAHLDIAGTAWTEHDSGSCPKGATGFGVRTLFEIARRWQGLAKE